MVNRRYVEQQAEGRQSSEKLPILYPSDVDGAPAELLLTVLRASAYRRDTMVRVEFREYPGRIIWAVKRGLLNVVGQLGEDESEWAGRRVLLEKVRRTNPRTGAPMDKYDFAPPRDVQARQLYPKATSVWDEPSPGAAVEHDGVEDVAAPPSPRPRRVLKRRPPRRGA